MTLIGICERCKEEKPTHVPFEKRRLTHGPNGEHLCSKHAKEAFEEEYKDE